MALNLTDALAMYGPIGEIANSIPEIKSIFAKAAAEEWEPAKFISAVKDTKWWATHSDTARNLVAQHIADPATYSQTINSAAEKVYLLQRELGLQPSSSKQLHSWATMFLSQNWDDEQIKRFLAQNTRLAIGQTGALSGNAAELEQHMRQVAANYGIPYTDGFLRKEAQKVLQSNGTLEGFDAIMRARAKAAYPQFATQLDSGLTLRDIADPYISTMANTLEISETDLSLTDSWIKKALNQRQPDGTHDAIPLWQFERQLKDDPRWDKTKQARQQAFETVAQIGKDFGFEGGS